MFDLTDNYNSYSFRAQQTTSALSLKVFSTVTANNYKDKDDSYCFAVNQNDFLGKIYIYNASAYKDKKFTVTAKVNGSSDPVPLGSPLYNSGAERLEFTLSTPICLTKVLTIDFN